MKKLDIMIVLIGAVGFAFVLNRFFPDTSAYQIIISPLADKLSELSIPGVNQESAALKALVEDELEGAPGTYGIVIKNLRTGETYTQNAERQFQPASLYKLWVTAYAFELINNGGLERDETVSRSIPEINRIFDIDEESAEQTEGTITRTVEEAIDQMITISHNYSALLLSSELGNSKIGANLRSLGLTSSRMGAPPVTTPGDIAKFYELLYDGKIVNEEISAEFIEILSRQELNDRIPKYLPQGVTVAHKTGELGAFKHDAGIIFADDAILFVALSETPSQVRAAETIAKLSEKVYEYFEK